MPKDILLSVSNLIIEFDQHVILNDLSFEIERDSTLAIIGPNGAGKTVLLRAILGLIPYEGKVEWAPNIKIGYVPQKLAVQKDLPLTVSEFLKFKEKDQKKIENALEAVGFQKGISEHLHNDKRVLGTKLGDLSGGEMQRVMIAYALLADPQVLLFDEPTAGVDLGGEETIYALISKLQKKADLTIVFISHELEVVYKYATNVFCLNKEKVCFGPPREVIDKESLQKLYGEDIHFYQHHEEDHEH